MKNKSLIAPCGMNCSLCMAYQRDKNRCIGCNGPDEGKPRSCITCKIKNCEEHKKKGASGFCYSCKEFPCERLKHLDKRYTTKYHMSMIENLKNIEEMGVEKFLKTEQEKWKCKKCQGLLCVHRDYCFNCIRLESKKKKTI